MKKYLLIFIISFCFYAQLNAQSNIQFPDSNASWYYLICTNTNPQPPPFIIECHTYHYYYEGDSLFNGIHYRYLKSCADSTSNICAPAGLIRVDTIQKKVFFIRSGWTFEQLLYNFNANVGDTISEVCACVVDSVDSIFTNTGYRKGFWTDYYGYIIDGIGSTKDLLWQIFFEHQYFMTCFFDDSTLVYSDPNFSTCNVIINIADNKPPDKKIAVTPNPVVNCSEIKNVNEAGPFKLNIFDCMGRKLISYSTHALSDLTICKNNLLPGFYILQLLKDSSSFNIPIIIN